MGSYITDETEYLILTRAVKCLAGRRNYKQCYYEPSLVKILESVNISKKLQHFMNLLYKGGHLDTTLFIHVRGPSYIQLPQLKVRVHSECFRITM